MHTDKTPVLSVCICVHLWLSFFKDHTIYAAVGYYTEGDTLYYFTSGNVHNQVVDAGGTATATWKCGCKNN
jgi:hypothetical protein